MGKIYFFPIFFMIYIPNEYLINFKQSQIDKFENLLQKLGTDEQTILRDSALNPISFLLISELEKNEKNVTLINECLQYLLQHQINSNKLTIQNNQLFMPPADTRGDNLIYTFVTEEEQNVYFSNLQKAKEILGKEWENLIDIVTVVTFVTITGKEELLTHFSGSNSDLWGAIHMNKNLDLINIIECITHEASHHWLNLFEFNSKNELIKKGWEDNSFISPWRRDRRPLMGILHGVYVFGNVFLVYNKLSKLHSEYDSDRMYYIGSQVKRGYEILEENLALISPETKSFLDFSRKDFIDVYDKLNIKKRNEFYQKVLSQEEVKFISN